MFGSEILKPSFERVAELPSAQGSLGLMCHLVAVRLHDVAEAEQSGVVGTLVSGIVNAAPAAAASSAATLNFNTLGGVSIICIPSDASSNLGSLDDKS